MRHLKKSTKLNMARDRRDSLLRNLATAVILFESVKTTRARAKQVQPIVEDLITKAKTRSGHDAIKQIEAVVYDKNASRKLLEVLKGRYEQRAGGYTRILKAGFRAGDAAEVVLLELV